MNDAAVAEVTDEVIPTEVETEVEAQPEVAESEEQVTQEAEPSDSSPEKKDGVQKRIDELVRARREAERERDALLQRVQSQPQPKPEPITADKTLADFDYDEGAYTSYLTDLAEARAAERVQQYTRQQRVQSVQQAYKAKEAEFAATVDDYDTVAFNPNLHISQNLASGLMESDMGPQLLYHLGKNPDVADNLSRMKPSAMLREMGRLEAKLSDVKPSVSKTPPPPPKVDAVEAKQTIKASSVSSDKLSTDEWLRRRNKELNNG